jgi:hypothetical protein
MKKILTIILAVFALTACDPNENSATEFNAENLVNTKWEGTLKNIENSAVKGTSDVTLRFDTASAGKFSQKRSGSSSNEAYDFSYSVSGKRINFDCPVISGTWEVTGYTDKTMPLALLPSKNGIMTLVIM